MASGHNNCYSFNRYNKSKHNIFIYFQEGSSKTYNLHMTQLAHPVVVVSQLYNVIPLHREVPELAILLVEVPDVHGVVVSYQLVTSCSIHVIYLRLKIMRLIRLPHLNGTEYDDKDSCSYVQILTLPWTFQSRSYISNKHQIVRPQKLLGKSSLKKMIC